MTCVLQRFVYNIYVIKNQVSLFCQFSNSSLLWRSMSAKIQLLNFASLLAFDVVVLQFVLTSAIQHSSFNFSTPIDDLTLFVSQFNIQVYAIQHPSLQFNIQVYAIQHPSLRNSTSKFTIQHPSLRNSTFNSGK